VPSGRIRRTESLAVAFLLALFLPALLAPAALGATFTVDDERDLPEVDPGDNVCAAITPEQTTVCTLRAAIQEANGTPATRDLISVPAGFYQLTAGALTISSNMEVSGEGALSTSVSGDGGDRVFDVAAGATVSLGAMTISDGRGNADNGHFGGNVRSAGTLAIVDSTLTNGQANSGGAVANTGGTLMVSRSTLTLNSAPADPGAGGDAGAILNFGDTGKPAILTIENSTISGNQARLTGGVTSYNNAENSVTIRDSTIAFNDSGDRGFAGGVEIGGGSATVRNSIVANNTSPVQPANPNCSGTGISSLGHNLESGTDCGFKASTDIQQSDPQLDSLGNNGGATDTHALLEGSPAIDAGDDVNCPATDQRGTTRPQRSGCDIGAFEAGPLPYMDIASSGPLTHIFVGNALGCQVQYAGDEAFSFFPRGGIPGDCGTFLRIGDPTASFQPISQSGVTGSGTQGDPFKVVTRVAAVDTAVELTRTDSYVVGDDFYRSDVTITNTGDGVENTLLWQGADCYLQDSDSGYGFYDAATGGVYCSASPNNSPPARLEGFVPLSPGSTWYEGPFSGAFDPGPSGFPNSCQCDELLDNGMGLAWTVDVGPFGSATRSFLTTFSPTGQAFDNLPPDTTITAGPPPSTTSTEASFSFQSSEAGSAFECRLDGGAFGPCASPRSFSGLTPGDHTFEVRATDPSGNVDPTPAARSWTVDPPAPAVTTQAARPRTVDELPVPQLGVNVNVQELSGQVFVGVRGVAASAKGARASQKGITFVPLSEARQIPVGSFLDTRRGKLRLQSARDPRGTRQNGDFSQGLFQVLQSRRSRGLTDVVLKGASFSSCRRGGRGKRATAAASIRRRLRANARGRFRTSGRHSAATVRGTAWLTADRCDGTLTKVTRGKVAVRDFRRRKTVVVRAGKSYLARAKR